MPCSPLPARSTIQSPPKRSDHTGQTRSRGTGTREGGEGRGSVSGCEGLSRRDLPGSAQAFCARGRRGSRLSRGAFSLRSSMVCVVYCTTNTDVTQNYSLAGGSRVRLIKESVLVHYSRTRTGWTNTVRTVRPLSSCFLPCALLSHSPFPCCWEQVVSSVVSCCL